MHLAGITTNPTSGWTTHVRNLLLDWDTRFRFVIRDRAGQYTRSFDNVFAAIGADVITIPPGAPQANAFAERWVRTVATSCWIEPSFGTSDSSATCSTSSCGTTTNTARIAVGTNEAQRQPRRFGSPYRAGRPTHDYPVQASSTNTATLPKRPHAAHKSGPTTDRDLPVTRARGTARRHRRIEPRTPTTSWHPQDAISQRCPSPPSSVASMTQDSKVARTYSRAVLWRWAAAGEPASVRCPMLKRQIVAPPEHWFPSDDWRIIEARWTPQFSERAETVFALANGYVGVRGTLDEGRPSFAPGTFISGFHETWPIVHAEEAHGLARVGQSMINAPDATVLELFVDDEPMFVPTARMRDYSRVLDMRSGTLERELTWSTPAGKHVDVRSCRLVSLEHRHLVVISYEVTIDRSAPIAIASRIINRADTHAEEGTGPTSEDRDPRLGRRLGHRILHPHLAVDDGDRIMLGYEVTNSGMTHALGVQHVVDTATPHRHTTSVTADLAEWVLSAEPEPGAPIRIVKYITYQTSRSVSPRDLAERCHRTLDRAVDQGLDRVVERQRAHLDRFWDRADVAVTDRQDPVRVQQAVRWNLFQLCQASWRVEGASIPSKGLTGGAYDGHYFWDTEAYVLPFLAYTQPRIARNLLRFRHSMLPKARERAAGFDLRGALFPWRTINGDEASALYQAGTAQYHINADIAYAIRRYVDVRGDTGFLAEVGAEILVETARMWEDLGFEGDDGRFHLHGVTGPDEYTTVVNDNAFTNLMARLNLRYAAAVVGQLDAESPDTFAALCFELSLDPGEVQRWQQAAENMFIPYDNERGITPQDDSFLKHERWDLENTPADKFPLLLHYHPLTIYQRQVIKQADVVMAMFLLGNEFTMHQKRQNFAYYDPLTTGDSSLSASIQSIVASEIGDYHAASRYFNYALLMDLANIAGNASDGVHIASTAGVWMALVFGFGGVRDFDGYLTFDTRLPPRFADLAFSLRFRERQIRVRLTHDDETYLVATGDPIDVRIRGDYHRLATGEPLTLPAPVGAEKRIDGLTGL